MRILDAFSLNGGKVVRSGRYEGVLACLKFQRKTCWLVSVTLCTGVDKSSFDRQRKEINQLNEGEEKSHSCKDVMFASISLASTEELHQREIITTIN